MLDVVIRAAVGPRVLAEIAAEGGTVRSTFAKYDWIRATVPGTAIEPLARLEVVTAIRPYLRPVCSKINTSQGDVAHRANLARTGFSVDGTSINVGVISDSASASQLATLIASGDLPSGRVTVLAGLDGTSEVYTDEGLAMLEIVYDLAPGADLFFATANGGEPAFADNIRALRYEAKCDVIVDDVSYLLEPVFQDGIVAQAVEEVVSDGAVYLGSAGNYGSADSGTSGVWEGDFHGFQTIMTGGYEYETHDFGDGDLIQITSSTTFVALKWADAFEKSGNDYDLFLFSPAQEIVAESVDWQGGDGYPDESFTVSGDLTGYYLLVARVPGAQTRYLHLNLNGGTLEIATSGQIFNHTAAESCLSVAAVDVHDAHGTGKVFDGTEPVEDYSSDGPRRVFYRADGTPITPGVFTATGGEVRSKPDLAAADGVRCATAGFNPFYGTSAAAPHAAAIAALLLQKNPGMTPAQVRKAFLAGALDLRTSGWDRNSGYGVLNAYAVVGNTPSAAPPPPVGVAASDYTYTDRVAVTWHAMPWATHYRVYRDLGAGRAATPVSGWQTATRFDDTTATPGTTYSYWVEAATSSTGANPSGLSAPDQGETGGVPQSLTISGPLTVSECTTASYSGIVTYTDGATADVTNMATWSENSTYAAIDDTGLLTATGVPANQSVTVTASYTGNGTTVTGTLDLTILDLPNTTYPLTVDSGSGSGSYSAGSLVTVTATPPGGLRLVSWTVDPPTYQGNLADAAAASTAFTMPPAAVALTYSTAEAPWAVALTLTGTTPTTLTLGAQIGATAGWDPGIDAAGSLPLLPGQACLASDDLATAYSADYREPAAAAAFLLIARADATAITVAWDLAGFPSTRFLSLYQVQIDPIAPSTTPVAMALLGNTGLNLAKTASLTIPAGETRCYVIRYGTDVVFDLALEAGWNLVSLPLEPVPPEVAAVLDDGQDGARGVLYRGDVWQWQSPGFLAATQLHACVGYWVYANRPAVLLVAGSPADQTALDLVGGWNLVGVETAWPVPSDSPFIGAPQAWDASFLRYQAATDLLPGRGYWVTPSGAGSIPISTR